jgi:hypothetical protein
MDDIFVIFSNGDSAITREAALMWIMSSLTMQRKVDPKGVGTSTVLLEPGPWWPCSMVLDDNETKEKLWSSIASCARRKAGSMSTQLWEIGLGVLYIL